MITVTKALAAYALAVSLALAVGGVVLRGEMKRNGALATQNKSLSEAVSRAAEQRKRDAKVLGAWQAKNASTARQLEQAQQGLSQARQANPGWSEAVVPDAVQKALHGAVEQPK